METQEENLKRIDELKNEHSKEILDLRERVFMLENTVEHLVKSRQKQIKLEMKESQFRPQDLP